MFFTLLQWWLKFIYFTTFQRLLIQRQLNIEDITNGKEPPQFKSEGERKIANFLSENSIKHEYERSVLVSADSNKPRIWYPDFYLQEFKTYIEYYGMVGNQNYDQGIKTKQAVYEKEGMDVISIYPWIFKENWRGYIMQELERNTLRPYRNLMAKPY